MSAAPVIRHLLASNASMTGAVPLERIFIGVIPQGAALPAVSITSISGMPHNALSMREARRLIKERIQVTVYAKSYPELDSVIETVRRAISNVRNVIVGKAVQAVIPDIVGPDLVSYEPQVYMRSRDYQVTYLQ